MDLSAFNLQGKVALITGGAHGIGFSIAEGMAKCGAVICFNCSSEASLEKGMAAYKAAGIDAHGYVADVTDEAAVNAMIAQIKADVGPVDILVNNAGINIRKPIEEMVKDEWMKMMEVNTASVFLATKYVLPVMRKQGGGAIINTSSICGLVGHMNTPEAYTATKGAITLLTKSVAARYGKDNIRCNSIHPATVDTPFVAALMADPVKKQARLNEIPLGRLTSVEDVANAVLYLASDEASFLNGVNLPIDGGVTCY